MGNKNVGGHGLQISMSYFAAIRKIRGRLCSDLLSLEFFRPAAFLVAHQNPSRLVPVGQHPAFADPAVDAVLVPRGAVGVAVDEAWVAVRAQQRLHRASVDVHDLGRLALLLDLAPRAQRRDALLALGERLCEEGPLPGFRAHFRAERLVFAVVGAQRVAVGEDGFFAEQVEHDRVVDELRAARLREARPEKEVAVAVHHEDARAAAGAFRKGRDDLRVEGIPDVVVARPVLEQVAEDVEIRGPEGAFAEKPEKDLIDPRPAAREVEVGDEKDRHSFPYATSAFSMTTSSTGTSPWDPRFPVLTCLILSTTSWPSTTLPNTQ